MKYPIYVLSAVLTVCCLQWSAAARSAESAKPREQVQKIHLRAGKLPSVELTADFLYRFLASEIAAQRGQYAAASQTLLDLSKDTLDPRLRSEEHTSELPSLMRISYAVFCLK